MRILFDKVGEGSEELRELTGSYYSNNEFAKIKTDVLLETESIIELVGPAVYRRAEDHYYSSEYHSSGDLSNINDRLTDHIRLPIALLASVKYYAQNLVSHEDSGRKVKIDNENEKLAWQWMLDRDDDAHIRKAYRTMDRLISFLDKENIDEWKNSEQRRLAKTLFLDNTGRFDDVYPIDRSPRFYYAILPLMKEVQNSVIKRTLGSRYNELLVYHQEEKDDKDTMNAMLSATRLSLALHVMILAAKRFSVQVLPSSVVQQFKDPGQSGNSSTPASQTAIKTFIANLEADATVALNQLKKELKTADSTANYLYLPENQERNKYFRT